MIFYPQGEEMYRVLRSTRGGGSYPQILRHLVTPRNKGLLHSNTLSFRCGNGLGRHGNGSCRRGHGVVGREYSVAAEPFLNGSSGSYIEAMYESWQADRTSVHKVGVCACVRACVCVCACVHGCVCVERNLPQRPLASKDHLTINTTL